jgi:hypothetical protein
MDILIPDTSSLINIHEVYVGQTYIVDVLNELFNVQVSREIPHEIRRRRSKLGNYDKQMLQFVRQARRYFHRDRDYEKILFNQFAPNGNPCKNRGERYNCALALWFVRKQQTGQVIMLTDDMNAQRGFIEWYENCFKTTKTWTSLDLLMHIYLVMFPKWTYAQAYFALKLVNPYIAGTRVEMTKRLCKYRRCLMQLHTMLKTLPSVKKRGES